MSKIDDAPTDGTRVLIKAEVLGFVPERPGSHFRVHKPVGTRWVECEFKDGEWKECHASVPRTINPLAWAPLPEDDKQ